ncbi:MAG: DUF1273 family protein [Candidatus Riesia sp.]|nr:DUF1273 family protein [Candidatus Riesia sp.]
MVIAFSGPRPHKIVEEHDDEDTIIDFYDETRPYPSKIKEWLSSFLADLLPKCPPDSKLKIITGGALGVDTWAAEAAQELTQVDHLLAVPFRVFHKRWPVKDQVRYLKIKSKATDYHEVGTGWSRYIYDERNKYMIDNCDLLVAVYSNTGGGTESAITYAARIDKPTLSWCYKTDTLVVPEEFKYLFKDG